ncbi:MAG: sulfur carrier protein ThiS [Porphyromonadaceae bacterium]|nr:sulfur carrier protein ThiS [Porphyromonadaceae bacterium]
MKIYLNRQEIYVGSRCTLKELLLGQSITPEGIAIAVNNRVIRKEDWADTFLSNNDKVMVIHASYGG